MLTNVCSGCGRTVEKSFIFCPWCGIQIISNDRHEYLDNISLRIENERIHEKTKHIENIGKQIDNLEKELDAIVLSTQLAR